MSGGIRKLKNGKWELSCSSGFDLKGKRIRKYKRVDALNKNEAKKLLAEFVTEVSKKDYSNGGTITLNDYYNLWIKDFAEKGLRKKTVSNYKTLWTRVKECLGHFEIIKIKPPHLIQFYNMLTQDGVRLDGRSGGLSPTTIKHHHTLISTMLSNAVAMELIPSNPCSKIKLSKIGISNRKNDKKNNDMIYSIDQIKELLKKIDKVELKYQAIIYLALFTGCRREEIVGLDWTDIDFETGKINIDKSCQYNSIDGTYEDELKNNFSERSCFVPKKVIHILELYKIWWDEYKRKATIKGLWIGDNKVFIQKDGSPIHPETPSTWFRKFLKRSNMPHTKFHNLRHMHISILVKMGMDLNAVADQAGHANLEMIMKTYSHNVSKNSLDAPRFLSKALFDE